MSTDFDALVGETVSHYAFGISCSDAYSTVVTITHSNPLFTPGWTSNNIRCGSTYLSLFEFSPTETGLTTDTVTFSSSIGNVTEQLIGNGVPIVTTEQWMVDLGVAGAYVRRMVYDDARDLLYATDEGNDQIIVFSPTTRGVQATIPVGIDPVGLAITKDSQKLYVANSGEYSISVVDLNTWTASKITIPTLYPNPDQDYEYWYLPYEIAIVSDTLALLGSDPPGAASGGPIYQLDLQTQTVAPRTDIGQIGRYPVMRTSRDFNTIGVVVEPSSSPTLISRYDSATDSAISVQQGIQRSIAISDNGSHLVVTSHDANYLVPDLAVFDESLNDAGHIQLIGVQAMSAVFSPVSRNYVYALEGRDYKGWWHMIEEARVDLQRQTRAFTYTMPYDHGAADVLVISDDGEWVFVPLNGYQAAKLLAIRVGPVSDDIPPESFMIPLSPTQTHNWWFVSWTGIDNYSGIDHYDVQYHTGDGNWNDWLSTGGTGSFFKDAVPGQTYYFRCRAVDESGNAELYPSDAETYTTAGSDTSGLSETYLPFILKH
jgi:YVTN family beta-propeller protein